MSRDIVDTSAPSDRLVVAARIEGERPDQLARPQVEDADVAICDQQLDRPALVGTANADVMKLESWRRLTLPWPSTLSWRTRKGLSVGL